MSILDAPSLTRRQVQTLARQPKLQLVAHHGDMAFKLMGNGANLYTRDEGRYKTKSPNVAIHGLRLVYGNWYVGTPAGGDGGANGGEQPGTNDITVMGAAYYSTGVHFPTILRARWGGNNMVVIKPGGTVISDSIGLRVPADTGFFTHSSSVVTSGQVWPGGRLPQSGESAYHSTAAVTQLDSISWSLPSGGTVVGGITETFGGFSPVAVLGIPERRTPAIWAGGDSILYGSLETPTGDGNGNFGFFARGTFSANGHAIPLMKMTRDQDQAQYSGADQRWAPQRYALMEYCTDCVTNWGTNDLVTGAQTNAQLQASLTHCWSYAKALGLRTWHILILPRTTSSNSFANAAGQTPVSGFETGGAKRDVMNAWALSQVGTLLDGVIDMNAVYEDPAAPGKWRTDAGYTTDGTHPTTFGHQQGAATISTWAANLLTLEGF